jgi:hypothetical protein
MGVSLYKGADQRVTVNGRGEKISKRAGAAKWVARDRRTQSEIMQFARGEKRQKFFTIQ